MLLLMLRGKHLTNKGCEMVMLFLNIVLVFLKLGYRFPANLSTFLDRMSFDKTYYKGIKTFVNCKSCHAIYDIPANNEEKKRHQHCTFINSTSSVSGLPLSRCRNELYTAAKNGVLNPSSVSVYNSVTTTLRQFFLRDGFMNSINSWRKRKLQVENYMFDVTDGKVWKTFKINDDDSLPFFDASMSNIVMSLNIDWLQVYTNASYSVGAIYMTILNLDRKVRNLRSNVVFVGLMAGPVEPKCQQINHYLKPLVDELKELMGAGIKMVDASGEVILVRGALILGCLDLPAAAKTFGSSSYNATFGCRKCDKALPAVKEGEKQRDYSGGWDGSWPRRTNESNRRHALVWKKAHNESERLKLVLSNGTRWSSLHDLPYFDMIRFPVYDPMHNVYLGTCKRMMHRVFLEMKYLDKNDLKEMSKITSKIIMPFGFDTLSLSRKIMIGEGFAYFKGDCGI